MLFKHQLLGDIEWWSRHLSVCHTAWLCCFANTAERIEVLFGAETLGDPRNINIKRELQFSRGFRAGLGHLLEYSQIQLEHTVNGSCTGRVMTAEFTVTISLCATHVVDCGRCGQAGRSVVNVNTYRRLHSLTLRWQHTASTWIRYVISQTAKH